MKHDKHSLLDERYVVGIYRYHMTARFGVFVDDDHDKLPTLLVYINFIKDNLNHMSLLILVRAPLLR